MTPRVSPLPVAAAIGQPRPPRPLVRAYANAFVTAVLGATPYEFESTSPPRSTAFRIPSATFADVVSQNPPPIPLAMRIGKTLQFGATPAPPLPLLALAAATPLQAVPCASAGCGVGLS